MRIAIGQINTTVGDLEGNVTLMVAAARQAVGRQADLVVFPELSVTGYPPRDLLEKPSFMRQAAEQLERLAAETAALDLAVLCGTVEPSDSRVGPRAANSAVLLERGKVVFRQRKMLLPSYDVFDEGRYFAPAEQQHACTLRGRRVAITVCEDAWNDKQFWAQRMYHRDPVEELVQSGADLLISINASPYHLGKRLLRQEIFASAARRYRIPVVYVNQVGGNDQLVFDGNGFALDQDGQVIAAAHSFREDLALVDLERGEGDIRATIADGEEAVYEALVLGTRDYVRKCGFRQALLGLSGGIDSTITAVIAVDAIGRENVIGVAMPGPFSSDHSLADARALADNLGMRFEVLPLTGVYEACLGQLETVFEGLPRDVTEENIQARLRGVTLMALSNKWGAMVLSTGNKSELAVGYTTLYGDMCGGLAVISDVPKTMVYKLARLANLRHSGAIPESVFTKPPSAELRPNQKDSDSLPEYEVLDAILREYIEENRPSQEIAGRLGLPPALVREVTTKVDRNEYKRQQAPPGLKVTSKAFGIGRRLPIAQRFSP